jgi:murein DD-endopeptidase MepM/ murein hydrolase activator NlpD
MKRMIDMNIFTSFALSALIAAFLSGCNATSPEEATVIKSQATAYKYYLPFSKGVNVINDYGSYHWNSGTGDGLVLDLYPSDSRTDILAMRDGTVAEVETGRSRCTPCPNIASLLYGNLVIVDHKDGFFSLYAHLASVNVSTGQNVQRGDKLGIMGETGNTYGAHLHLELRSGVNADNSYYYNVSKTLPSFVEAGGQAYQQGATYVSQNERLSNNCAPSGGGQGHGWTPSGGWTALWGDDDNNGAFARGTYSNAMQYWWKDGSDGGGGDSWFTYEDNVADQNYAYWRFSPPSTGIYDVYVYLPNALGNSGNANLPKIPTTNASYQFQNASGYQFWVERRDQYALRGCWVKLRSDTLQVGTQYQIYLGDDTSSTAYGRVYYDSAAIKKIADVPTVGPWTVTPTSMTFNGVVGGATPAAQPFTIKNNGGAQGTFSSFSTNDTWLGANGFNTTVAGGGTTPGNATVTACTAVGTTTGELRFSGNGSTATISVTRVCAGTPVWSAPGTLTLPAGVVGGSSATSVFNITNSGNAAGNPTVTSSNPSVIGLSMVDANPIAASGGTRAVTVNAVACLSVGTQTGTITVSGGGASNSATVNVSRTCTAALPPIPLPPATLTVTMSSNGRLFVSWPASSGATSYSFAGTFDGQPFSVTDTAPQPSGSRASAVAMVTNNPTDANKAGKQLCLQTKASNAGGSSALTALVCATYQYYASTGLSVQSLNDAPQLKLILP